MYVLNRVPCLFLLAICSNAYGEEAWSPVDTKRSSFLELSVESLPEMFIEDQPSTFASIIESKTSSRKKALEKLQLRWQLSASDKRETTITLSEDKKKFLRIEFRF